ncbi:MAG: dTMP kinase [Desulfobulbus propionicus]|nr:MAG: dTMP kinase [Desulfobulbus propionicus]
MKGKLIVFEGIDGAGKTTQLELLAAFLRDHGKVVLETREPTEGPFGQQIRALFHDRRLSLEEELQLFIEDRRMHVEQYIQPALDQGAYVLTDRYYYSTAAYQGAQGADPDFIFSQNQFAPSPDLVILLTLSPEESAHRIEQCRGEQPNAFEQQEQLTRVADLFASFTDPAIVRVDAARTLDIVQQDIVAVVRDRLPL